MSPGLQLVLRCLRNVLNLVYRVVHVMHIAPLPRCIMLLRLLVVVAPARLSILDVGSAALLAVVILLAVALPRTIVPLLASIRLAVAPRGALLLALFLHTLFVWP